MLGDLHPSTEVRVHFINFSKNIKNLIAMKSQHYLCIYASSRQQSERVRKFLGPVLTGRRSFAYSKHSSQDQEQEMYGKA